MSSDSVIDRLVSDLTPVRPADPRRDVAILAALALAEVGLFLMLGQGRPDLDRAMLLPSFWWKLASMAVLASVAVAAALRSFAPIGSPRPGLRIFAAIAVAALAAGWALDVAQSDAGGLGARLMWRHGLECVFAMLVLSLPPAIALALLMRRGAPVDRGASALAAGLASAAWGSAVFVFNCPHDDPVYVAFWYVLGCALIALVTRQVLMLVARW